MLTHSHTHVPTHTHTHTLHSVTHSCCLALAAGVISCKNLTRCWSKKMRWQSLSWQASLACVCVCVYLHICFWFLSFMAYIQFDVLLPSPFLSCNHEINKSASMFESNLSLCQLFTFVFYMFFFISYMTLRCLWACRRPAPCFTTSINHLWSGKQASPIGGLSTPCCNTTSLERAMWRMSNACVCSPAPLRQFLMQS